MKVVIVGGVAGGASAAARIRRLDEKAKILVFERSGYVSYANCGLPYYAGGVIEDRRELTLQTPESFWHRFHVDVRVHHEVMSINTKDKTVFVRNLKTGEEFEESYDKLLLSPGAKPFKPSMIGLEDERIFTLRTVEDTLRIRSFLEEKKPKAAVIAGGGYIGLEMAENLAKNGVAVTIVQKPDHLLAPIDWDMACLIHTYFAQKGISVVFGHSVTGFTSEETRVTALLDDGAQLHADMVLLAIGVTPDTNLAKKAGLKTGIKGSIVVNEYMETSEPDIYAVGDAVEVEHSVTGQRALISLAGPANKQGRIAADNICGGRSTYRGSQGSSVLKLFDMTVATTGINEVTAKAAGIAYDKVVLSPGAHASYYPGSKVMTMKVLYEKESLRILGAQIIGYDGVDKRIDVLATAIHAGLKATELSELDLAYAPPYSSAKDPVNMAGFMIENIVTGKVRQFHWEQVDSLPRDGSVTLIDARTPMEYARGHVEGFVNIPLDSLRERIDEIEQDKPVYVMCQSGLRSYLFCRILEENGYTSYNFSGGYRFFETVTWGKNQSCNTYPCGMNK